MFHQIKKIEARPGHLLFVQFENGQTRLFNMKPYLDKGVFKELRNESYFKKVRKISGGVEWPHEQDLSADTLYHHGERLK